MITAIMIITLAIGMLSGLFLAHVHKEFEEKPKTREDDDEVDNYRSNYHCRD